MSVQYNVSSLLKDAVGATRDYDLDSRMRVDDEGSRRQQIVGRLTLLRTQDGVLVTANLRGVHADRCSRCLLELEIPIEIELEEEFVASVDVDTGAKMPSSQDADTFRIDGRHTLDVEDAIRQHWTTAVPIKPLCEPDCRGLCPRCGRDLNQGACSCPPDVDERWSALRHFVGEK